MQRNKCTKENFPVDLFDKPLSVEMICSCLQRFVLEARRKDGTRYPPKLFISCLVDYYNIPGKLNLCLLIFLIKETHI